MRARKGILALVLAASSFTAEAEPYRDDLAVPSYRLLASMLAQFHDRAPLERAARSVEVVAPLVRALDHKYGADVERTLRRAIGAGDGGGAFVATTILVVLDAEDLIEGIHRDDYTGWTDARVRTKKAFLDYGLVAEEVRRGHPALDRRLIMDFSRLALALRDSDLSTQPEPIDVSRGAVIADLIAVRAAMAGAVPAGGGGGG